MTKTNKKYAFEEKKLRCLFNLEVKHKNLINCDRVRRTVVKIICHLCLMNVVIIIIYFLHITTIQLVEFCVSFVREHEF